MIFVVISNHQICPTCGSEKLNLSCSVRHEDEDESAKKQTKPNTTLQMALPIQMFHSVPAYFCKKKCTNGRIKLKTNY